MGRHLTPTGTRVFFSADSLKQSFEWCNAEHKAKGPVAIIRIDPVDARSEQQARCGGYRFMSRAGDLEINFVLALKLNLAIVQFPRKVHRAIQTNEGIAVEAMHSGGVKLGNFDARL